MIIIILLNKKWLNIMILPSLPQIGIALPLIMIFLVTLYMTLKMFGTPILAIPLTLPIIPVFMLSDPMYGIAYACSALLLRVLLDNSGKKKLRRR